MRSARTVLATALLMLAATLVLGTSSAGATSSPAPWVKVSPARHLADGDVVTVAGGGLPPRTTISVIQCTHLDTNNTGEGCGSDKTVTSDRKGRVLTRLPLKATLTYSGPVGPGFPIFCRADTCRVILAWGDPDLGEQEAVESRTLEFTGSPATIRVSPSTDLARKQWVSVTGTAFGAEGRLVGVRQHICSRHADADCFGDQRYVWTRVRHDGTYRTTYLVRRFVPTHDSPSPTRVTDCVYLADEAFEIGSCMMTAVILDRSGHPDGTFGSAEYFGEPSASLEFAH